MKSQAPQCKKKGPKSEPKGRYFPACDGSAMTVREIADVLGVSRAAVWASLQSGLRKLRRRPEAIARLSALAELCSEIRERSGPREAA